MADTRFKAPALVSFFLIIVTATASAQQFESLIFNGSNGGNIVGSALVQGPDGALYGMTEFGGSELCAELGSETHCGTIFKITPQGKLTTIYNFCSKPGCPEGYLPLGGLVLGVDGNFYGGTFYGGNCPHAMAPPPCGALFKVTPQGQLTVLYSFCSQAQCADGGGPVGQLLQAEDGNFYGATEGGGFENDDCLTGCGTNFRLTPSGQLTTLYTLVGPKNPYAGLVEGPDGNFYGTTSQGGNQGYACMNQPGCGAVYKISRTGDFSVVYWFCPTDCEDGANPGALTLAPDGKFYGFAELGGQGDQGTFFSVTPDGQFTTIYKFCALQNCTDGSNPSGPAVLATDGSFYGGTQWGGNVALCQANGCGTFFKITPNGTLTTLHTFDNSDGWHASASLQAITGVVFGSTSTGGTLNPVCSSQGCGTLFGQSTGLAPFVSLVRNPARVGQMIGILGQGLTGTTNVSINGAPATFRIVSSTLLEATVPSGAKTGYVTVSAQSGTLRSNTKLVILH